VIGERGSQVDDAPSARFAEQRDSAFAAAKSGGDVSPGKDLCRPSRGRAQKAVAFDGRMRSIRSASAVSPFSTAIRPLARAPLVSRGHPDDRLKCSSLLIRCPAVGLPTQ
jgi:hypothetical protein